MPTFKLSRGMMPMTVVGCVFDPGSWTACDYASKLADAMVKAGYGPSVAGLTTALKVTWGSPGIMIVQALHVTQTQVSVASLISAPPAGAYQAILAAAAKNIPYDPGMTNGARGSVGATFGGWGDGGGSGDEPVSTGGPYVGKSCADQSDCGQNMYCGKDGTCQQGPNKYACNSNSDCDLCTECQKDTGTCMYTGGNNCPGISDGSEDAACKSTQDCQAGLYCGGGRCSIGPTQGTCASDSDCDSCEGCYLGRCAFDGFSNNCDLLQSGKQQPSNAGKADASEAGSSSGAIVAGVLIGGVAGTLGALLLGAKAGGTVAIATAGAVIGAAAGAVSK